MRFTKLLILANGIVFGAVAFAAPGEIFSVMRFPFVADSLANKLFFYDGNAHKCLNSQGEEGFNASTAAVGLDRECQDFSGQTFHYFRGVNVNFRGTRFNGAWFSYVGFAKGADFTGASFKNSRFPALDLSDTDLRDADFSGSDMPACEGGPGGAGVCLQGARYNSNTVLPFAPEEAKARGMVFIGSEKRAELLDIAGPEMTCTIKRPGVQNSAEESVTVPFSTHYQREFPDQKVQLFIGFYEGLMQINLYERQATGSLENLASARTHDANSDVWLASRRWRLDVHCRRTKAE